MSPPPTMSGMHTLPAMSLPPPSRRRRLATVAVATLAAAVLATGCGPPTVSLGDLAVEADRFDGHDVVVHGVVISFGVADGATRDHHVLQDAAQTRVRLVPDSAAAPHVGAPVRVRGLFRFDPTEGGRTLEVEEIVASGD